MTQYYKSIGTNKTFKTLSATNTGSKHTVASEATKQGPLSAPASTTMLTSSNFSRIHLFLSFFLEQNCICNPDIATNSVCFQILTLAICLRGK